MLKLELREGAVVEGPEHYWMPREWPSRGVAVE